MPGLPLTTAHVGRPRLGSPALRAVNCYFEQTPNGPTQDIRTRRPGLTLAYTIGSGPILRAYQFPGLFGSQPVFVSGGMLYLGSTLIGSVGYSTAPRMAGAQGQLAITAGGGLYVYNGTTLVQVSTFSSGGTLPSFGGCVVLYNIWIFWVAGSQTWFFSQVGSPSIINAANVSAAQVNPDVIVEMAVLAEELYIFKGRSTEVWDYQGSLTAPFAESPGRTLARGCACQNSVVLLDNALFWIGDDFTVYRSGTTPQRVSTPIIEDQLRAAGSVGVSQATASVVSAEGHVFYVINLPTLNESWAYDCQTQKWFQWGSQDGVHAEPGIWRGGYSTGNADQTYIGDYQNGNVYLFDTQNQTDNGVQIRVVVGGAVWKSSGIERCNRVALQLTRGTALSGTASKPPPLVWLRMSDDGGRTWSSWLAASLGTFGANTFKVQWTDTLGPMVQPGRVFEFAISDPIITAIQGATYNEARI